MNPLEAYLRELRDTRSIGAVQPEQSYYGALANLLNEIGKTLKPKVRCIMQLKNLGAGMPDGGLFTADQFQKSSGEAVPDQLPSRGVIEIKPAGDPTWVTADGPQVSRYWGKYRSVLVTNYCDFVLLGRDPEGGPAKLESYRLAETEPAFWAAAAHPRKTADEHGERFIEFLKRVMLHEAPLASPQALAWFLASYARDAKARIEQAPDLPALAAVRQALEEALGLKFEGDKGEHFFRSSLVQTLFYGVFSAWVLWASKHPQAPRSPRFEWRMAAWSLRVPMVRALFEQVATQSKLGPLGLVEVLGWAEAALNRVDREAFFAQFHEGQAVQYFYEPFLQAFDPELRKDLGVWFTPPEIVQYMVARVDTVLREELEIEDGLADPRVYVLDPCCGTGSYLVEVLHRIAATLKAKGGDALVSADLKRAAVERIFGFEILPAPFVVAHLQLGLLLDGLGSPLDEDRYERAAIYLTNALTGWEPPKGPKQHLVFPELEQERDAADKVKQETPILVILGNPPYNGFAGVAVDEERDLTNAYRTTKKAPAPQGQGLNDLYVRFFRVAERRIVEKTGQGIVCFISNYSWLDGLSHTGMRERYLEVFDRIWIDCLNGDKYKTGKLTPLGEPDPSIFSTEMNREGIQIGTAIALLAHRREHTQADRVFFRHFWGRSKRAQLVQAISGGSVASYQDLLPKVEVGNPFMPSQIAPEYLLWPSITSLIPEYSPGINTSRDQALVEIDRERLVERMRTYFDPEVCDDDVGRIAPALMEKRRRFDPRNSRALLVKRGLLAENFVPYGYRPLDARWVYWEPETKLLDEKREDLFAAFRLANLFMTSRQKAEREFEGTPFLVTKHLPDRHLTRPGSMCFPLRTAHKSKQPQLDFSGTTTSLEQVIPNLSEGAIAYLASLRINPLANVGESDVLWMHVLAVGSSTGYLSENADALWQDYPRIPLPATSEALESSAALGQRVAGLLDTESGVKGVTSGKIRAELRAVGVVSRVGGGSLNPAAGDLAVTAGWGHAGKGGVTMPGKGKAEERAYTAEELAAIEQGAAELGLSRDQAIACLGKTTFDVYLNGMACWRNVPARVWDYTIGGYQVMKKWLSYRERDLLGRPLSLDEAHYVTEMARRLAALALLAPALDANYAAVKANAYPWPSTEA